MPRLLRCTCVVLMLGLAAQASVLAQAAPTDSAAARLRAPTPHAFEIVSVGPFALDQLERPAFADRDDDLLVSLKAHPSFRWVWLGRGEHGASICAGECTLRLAPGVYRFGLTREGGDVAALPPLQIESSGVLEGRYYPARRVDIPGAILAVGGLATFAGGVATLASGGLDTSRDRQLVGSLIATAVVLIIVGAWRLLRTRIRERHHYTPWVI